MNLHRSCFLFGLALVVVTGRAQAPLPIVTDIEWQPLAAQARRVAEALDFLGEPLSPAEKTALDRAASTPGKESVDQLQRILDPHVLFAVRINPEMRVSVTQ